MSLDSRSFPPKKGDLRTASRMEISVEGAVSNSAIKRRSAELQDISLIGCRLAWPFQIAIGTRLMLTLPGLAPIAAIVKWKNGISMGMAFETPLHPAVLERIIASTR